MNNKIKKYFFADDLLKTQEVIHTPFTRHLNQQNNKFETPLQVAIMFVSRSFYMP